MNIHTFLCAIPAEAAHELPKVSMLGTEESTYAVARLIMSIVDWIFRVFGLANHPTLELWIYSILVFAISWGIGYIAQLIILFIVNQVSKRWKNPIYTDLMNAKFFNKISRIIPALFFLIFIQFTMQQHSYLSSWLSRITWVFLSFIIARCLTIVAYIIWHHVDQRENKKHLPLNGLVQLICGIIWILFAIVAVSILVDKSPGTLLAGIGVFASVLMLVFKDSILGVVAGVQLSENDSVHVGDWIAVDGTNANGTVIGVSLTEVKVQNWDKTVTSVPPYNLITGSFTTYLPMQESNTRRIARTYLIASESVQEATPELLAKISEIPLMKDWIAKKQAQKAAGKEYCVKNPEGLADGTIDTNLGMFRAYMKMWLQSNPNISQVDDLFVNTLQQTAQGIPFQVYCFTSTSQWIPYEGIQSAVFEHVAAMLTKFNLFVYERESSRAAVQEGVMSRQIPSGESIFGLPSPMIVKDSQSPSQTQTPSPSPNQG